MKASAVASLAAPNPKGAQWVNCISLSGSNDWGEFPPDGSGAHNIYDNAITVEAWINPVETTGTQRIVHMHGTISFYMDGANLVAWLFGDGAPANFKFPGTSSNPLTAGVWQHVACTYSFNPSNSEGTVKFYRDGALIGAPQVITGAQKLENFRDINWQMIGTTSWHTEFFKGMIDEVRISKVARVFAPPSAVADWAIY
jgi:hypothetical protein